MGTSYRGASLLDFQCAICLRIIDMRWNRAGVDQAIEPLCLWCEKSHSEGVGKPQNGSFRDRRNVRRGIALANALHDEAIRQTWSKRYGIA